MEFVELKDQDGRGRVLINPMHITHIFGREENKCGVWFVSQTYVEVTSSIDEVHDKIKDIQLGDVLAIDNRHGKK